MRYQQFVTLCDSYLLRLLVLDGRRPGWCQSSNCRLRGAAVCVWVLLRLPPSSVVGPSAHITKQLQQHLTVSVHDIVGLAGLGRHTCRPAWFLRWIGGMCVKRRATPPIKEPLDQQ
jgi:hypothetical protein